MTEPTLPDGVLLIRYSELSSEPLVRLEVCRAIGHLLENSGQTIHLTNLSVQSAGQEAFKVWLNSDEASMFWQLDSENIIPIKPCTSHILIGTRHLLADLNQMQIAQAPNLVQLDLLWQAAAQWLAYE